MRIQGQGLRAEQLRDIPLGLIVRSLQHRVWGIGKVPDPEPPTPLRRVRGEAEDFAEQVARQYRYHAARTSAPAKAIAAAHDVPVTTVHRWIREARKLGELPRGQQGRVG